MQNDWCVLSVKKMKACHISLMSYTVLNTRKIALTVKSNITILKKIKPWRQLNLYCMICLGRESINNCSRQYYTCTSNHISYFGKLIETWLNKSLTVWVWLSCGNISSICTCICNTYTDIQITIIYQIRNILFFKKLIMISKIFYKQKAIFFQKKYFDYLEH